jgi:hypothetical protein
MESKFRWKTTMILHQSKIESLPFVVAELNYLAPAHPTMPPDAPPRESIELRTLVVHKGD